MKPAAGMVLDNLRAVKVTEVDGRPDGYVVTLRLNRAVSDVEWPFLEAWCRSQRLSADQSGSKNLRLGAPDVEALAGGLDLLMRRGFEDVRMRCAHVNEQVAALREKADALLEHFAGDREADPNEGPPTGP